MPVDANIPGIYRLNFNGGFFYIGQARSIIKRINEHQENLAKGKGSASLQRIYDEAGLADHYTIMLGCNPEFLDIMEAIYINRFNSPKCVNTIIPPKPDHAEEIYQYFNKSDNPPTLHFFIKLHERVKRTKLKEPDPELVQAKAELKRLSQLNWFDRLFNYNVITPHS